MNAQVRCPLRSDSQNLHLGILHRCLESLAFLVENICYRRRQCGDSCRIVFVVILASCVNQCFLKDGTRPDAVSKVKPRYGSVADAAVEVLTSCKEGSLNGLRYDVDLDQTVNCGSSQICVEAIARLTQPRYSATSITPMAVTRMSDM